MFILSTDQYQNILEFVIMICMKYVENQINITSAERRNVTAWWTFWSPINYLCRVWKLKDVSCIN